MACGCPVVGSTRASVPEVVGDAGLLADPAVPADFAAAMRRLRGEPTLRAELVRRGRERAATLTWDRTAERTLALLHEAATTAPGAPRVRTVGAV
jgi:glycosyltransferase involved in cell wall biosynthesis